jgi:hypothetical protein
VSIPTPLIGNDLGAILHLVAEHLDPQPDPYVSEPTEWIKVRLGEAVWSKQVEILESVRDNKYTSVRSAHSTGKSHIAARAIAWWVDTHPVDDVFIVSTAPSAPQVKAILWRYLKQIKRKAGLPGYITEAEVPEWKIHGSLVGWGRKPADLSNAEEASTTFQGIHAKYVLVVLDEAGGIPEWLWNAVDTLVTSTTNRVLAIGNPDDPTSHFERINRPGSGWHKIKISAYDSPNFTDEEVPQEVSDALVGPEWVEERRRNWGEDSPLFISKVLAEFPITSDDNLIPIIWIRNAMERDFSGEMIADQGKTSMDVARSGPDESTLAWWRGGVFRIIRAQRGVGDTMKLVGWLSRFFADHPDAKGIVDADGLGSGVFDRARELLLPISPFFAGRSAFNKKKFVNRRSEQWWQVRGIFEAGLIDIDEEDEELQSQLSSIKWRLDSAGRIAVETKKEMKARGLPSPDRADTLMMVTAPMDDWTDTYADPVFGISRNPATTITGDLLEKDML